MKTQERRKMKQRIKSYEELGFTDDFMFGKVLQSDDSLCRELIELILGRSIGEIITSGIQYTIAARHNAKGVRLDVLVKDSQDVIYDIEMQVVTKTELPKRSRYYHGLLAMDQMRKGGRYGELRETYVIFICKDGIGKEYDRAIYTYQNRCNEDTELTLKDGTHTIFVNARSRCEKISDKLRAFLDYVRTGAVEDDPYVQKLDGAVRIARDQPEWRAEYMMLIENYEMFWEDGREEGRKEGLIEGGKSKALSNIISLTETMHMSVREAMDALKIPKDEQEEYLKELKLHN